MPVDIEDGAANRLLEVFGDPPIALFVVVTNRDGTGAGTDSKFSTIGRPADAGCRSVEAEQDESRLPRRRTGLRVRRQAPDVGIAILWVPLSEDIDERRVCSPASTRRSGW